MTLQPGKQTFEIQILRNISRSKGNQIIKSTTRSLIIFKKWISKKSFLRNGFLRNHFHLQ